METNKTIMKIPKYIETAIKKRCHYATLLDNQCQIIDAWLSKNGIEAPYDDCYGAAEIFIHPKETRDDLIKFLKSL